MRLIVPSLPEPWPAGPGVDAAERANVRVPAALTLAPEPPVANDPPLHLPRPDIYVIFWALAVAVGMSAFDRNVDSWRLAGRILLSTIAGVAFGPATYHFVVLPTRLWPWPLSRWLPAEASGWLALASIICWSAFGYRFFGGIRTLGERFQRAPMRAVRLVWWLAWKAGKGVPEPPPPEPLSPSDPEGDTLPGYARLRPRSERLP